MMKLNEQRFLLQLLGHLSDRAETEVLVPVIMTKYKIFNPELVPVEKKTGPWSSSSTGELHVKQQHSHHHKGAF